MHAKIGVTNPLARPRTPLFGIMLVCVLPVVLSLLVYYVWRPEGRHSYGNLLETRPYPLAVGQPAWPVGQWVLVSVEPAGCGQVCAQRQFRMGQLRKALGEEAGRMSLLRIASAHAAGPGGPQLKVSEQVAHSQPAGLVLVDPLGNQVMHYADQQEPGPIIKELRQLLRNNNGLG